MCNYAITCPSQNFMKNVSGCPVLFTPSSSDSENDPMPAEYSGDPNLSFPVPHDLIQSLEEGNIIFKWRFMCNYAITCPSQNFMEKCFWVPCPVYS